MDLIEQVLQGCSPEITTVDRVEPNRREAYCSECNQRLTGDLYRCICGLNLCLSCYQLPLETNHWLHPHHPLVLQFKHLLTTQTSRWGYDVYCCICEGCLLVSFGRVYLCHDCQFRCCIECAFSTASRMPIEWESHSILHYSHLHDLKRCRYKRRLDPKYRECPICELPLWGICYGCVRCAYFIHESCVDSPQEILHPIHPLHPLKRLSFEQDYAHGDVCKACTQEIWYKKPFRCDECGFILHLKCADSLLRTIQHGCHPHALLYRPPSRYASEANCTVCNKSVSRWKEYFFRCVQCDLSFHFDCVSIPYTIKHPHHLHSLTLVDSFFEGDYYCNICETRRKPHRHAYCCKECKFAGHIECVLSKEEDLPKFLSCLSAVATYSKGSSDKDTDNQQREEQIHSESHEHSLSLSDAATHDLDNPYCSMCNLEVGNRTFACLPCKFWVHKRCAELPKELPHPLHPHHPLTLLKRFRYGRAFMCNICTDVSDAFCFLCRACNFIIDVKCAFETQGTYTNKYKDLIRELDHPVHGNLLLVNPTGKYASIRCRVCNQKMSGIRYACLNINSFGGGECAFFHESCLQWPTKLERHPLHPSHPLFLANVERHYRISTSTCHACGYGILAFSYICEDGCQFALHIECANSLVRLLKHKVHDHSLHYCNKRPSIGLEPSSKSAHVCSLCRGQTKASYYRCVECELNFHLKCLQLPPTAKHKWHLHWLVYKDSVDLGGYYCDICEEERDFQHPVYFCRECKLVAHVDCLISEENASRVVLEEIESADANGSSVVLEEIESEGAKSSRSSSVTSGEIENEEMHLFQAT